MVQKEIVGLKIKDEKSNDSKVRIIKERFRNHKIKFIKPLSNIILEDLQKKEKFFTKYTDIIAIIFGKDTKGITFNDTDGVLYNLTANEIGASSPIATDSEVIRNLRDAAETILKIYEMPEKEYELIEGADFQYLEGYNLQNSIEKGGLINQLQDALKKNGNLSLVSCKFAIKEGTKNKMVNLTYPTEDDVNKNKLLVESDKEYLDIVMKVLKKCKS